jgi:hypothetical protein
MALHKSPGGKRFSDKQFFSVLVEVQRKSVAGLWRITFHESASKLLEPVKYEDVL